MTGDFYDPADPPTPPPGVQLTTSSSSLTVVLPWWQDFGMGTLAATCGATLFFVVVLGTIGLSVDFRLLLAAIATMGLGGTIAAAMTVDRTELRFSRQGIEVVHGPIPTFLRDRSIPAAELHRRDTPRYVRELIGHVYGLDVGEPVPARRRRSAVGRRA